MIEEAVSSRNLTRACYHVMQNKGSAGVDSMPVTELKVYLDKNREAIVQQVIKGAYLPLPIKGVAIPKSNGKTRLLGVPAVIDRMLQQAMSINQLNNKPITPNPVLF